MSEMPDSFKTPTGVVIPYTVIREIGHVGRLSLRGEWPKWFFRIDIDDAAHGRPYGNSHYMARYSTEFEALAVKCGLEASVERYRDSTIT